MDRTRRAVFQAFTDHHIDRQQRLLMAEQLFGRPIHTFDQLTPTEWRDLAICWGWVAILEGTHT